MTSTLAVERIDLRAGDSLPGFAAVIEDHNGVAANLADSLCYLQVIKNGVMVENECTIANPTTATVTYDWTGTEIRLWGVGTHELRVRVLWNNGDALIAPADRSCLLVIKPEIASLL